MKIEMSDDLAIDLLGKLQRADSEAITAIMQMIRSQVSQEAIVHRIMLEKDPYQQQCLIEQIKEEKVREFLFDAVAAKQEKKHDITFGGNENDSNDK